MQHRESDIQAAIVRYFRYAIQPKFRDAQLIVNPLADTYFGKEGARIMQQAARRGFEKGLPDILIIQQTITPAPDEDLLFSEGYPYELHFMSFAGIALELKSDNANVYKQNGELIANEHVQRQARVLEKLRSNYIIAEFAQGFDEAMAYLSWYFDMNTY